MFGLFWVNGKLKQKLPRPKLQAILKFFRFTCSSFRDQNSNFLCKKPNETVKKIKNCQSQLSLLRLGWSSPVMITLGPVVQKSADQICVSFRRKKPWFTHRINKGHEQVKNIIPIDSLG